MTTSSAHGTIIIDAPPPSHECPLLSRRQFLRGVAAGAAVVAVSSASGHAFASTGAVEPDFTDEALGMLVDVTRCTGCNACALACKVANDRRNPTEVPTRTSYDAFSFVDEQTIKSKQGHEYSVFIKRQCMHCLHPACVSACTVGALHKTAQGPVVYDEAKCIGCRYCQYACPFGLPAYDWDNPLGLIGKCEMCVTRLEQGELPACVAACPNGAIRFGKRTELLAQAHAQIQSNPGRYINHVYGEHEVGGTSILYLSPVSFTTLGFPAMSDEVIPSHAEAVMKKTPVVAVTVAALAAAIQFITRQRGGHAEFAPPASAAENQPDQEARS